MAIQSRSTLLVVAAASALALSGCVTVNPNRGGDEQTPPATTAPLQLDPTTPTEPTLESPTQAPPQSASVPPEVPAVWTDTLEQVSTGVVKISTGTCDGPGLLGSGFPVSDTLIVTNAHVVADAAAVTVGQAAATAEIIGYSEEADLALLRVAEPVEGHIFSWAEEPPRLGQDVSVLGYPLRGGLTSVQGVVSSPNARPEGFSDTARYVQTDAAVNPGNSGGPLVTIDGDVLGVVFAKGVAGSAGTPVEGTAYALSYQTAQSIIDDWATAPQSVPLVECPVVPGVPQPTGDVPLDVTVASDHESAAAVAQSLALHGDAINRSQYDAAFGLFTPSMQEQMEGVEVWREGLLTTYWQELAVLDVSGSGDTLTARALVRTTQDAADGPDGQTCSIFALDYTMVQDEQRGIWLINEVQEREDPRPC